MDFFYGLYFVLKQVCAARKSAVKYSCSIRPKSWTRENENRVHQEWNQGIFHSFFVPSAPSTAGTIRILALPDNWLCFENLGRIISRMQRFAVYVRTSSVLGANGIRYFYVMLVRRRSKKSSMYPFYVSSCRPGANGAKRARPTRRTVPRPYLRQTTWVLGVPPISGCFPLSQRSVYQYSFFIYS